MLYCEKCCDYTILDECNCKEYTIIEDGEEYSQWAKSEDSAIDKWADESNSCNDYWMMDNDNVFVEVKLGDEYIGKFKVTAEATVEYFVNEVTDED